MEKVELTEKQTKVVQNAIMVIYKNMPKGGTLSLVDQESKNTVLFISKPALPINIEVSLLKKESNAEKENDKKDEAKT